MHRLTDEELSALLDDLESELVERKESFRSDEVKAKARQAVCAFANDLPGYNRPGVLIFGVKDNGEPSDFKVTEDILNSLGHMKTDGRILPLPVLTVEKRRVKGTELAVVTVFPSDMPPVKFEGRIWIRTGARRSIANEQEERILVEKRRFKNLPFDLYPVPTATIRDLSRTIFENEFLPRAFAQDVLEANHRSFEQRLASCRMTVSPDEPTPTIVGLLSIGKSPQDFMPGARIEFHRINGQELADPVIDSETIGGTVVEMLRRTEEKLRAHNFQAVDITSEPTHQITSTYPQAAIQQIVYNSVLHRTYEGTNAPTRVYWFNDRIEINSPGGPYGSVNINNFGKPGVTDYRNPSLADVMKTFGFVQAFGRGIAVARKAMKDNGNPEPEFEVTPGAVVCTLRAKA